MATYYVKKTGSDSLSGTSVANAWATVTKAFQTAAAGDVVYIGPGIYREKPTVSNSGSSGNEIYFIGDPMAKFVTGETPGIVRITGAGTNEIATSGTIITCNKYYINFQYLYVDGSLDGYGFTSGSSYTPKISNCVIQNCRYGAYYYNVSDTLIFNVYSGISGSTSIATRCVIFPNYYGINAITTAESCIIVGGYYAFYLSTNVVNCTAISSNYGFRGASGTSPSRYNCTAISCYWSFYQGQYFNCYAIGGRYGYGTCEVNDSWYSCCYTNTSTTTTGTGYSAPAEAAASLYSFVIQKFMDLFIPILPGKPLNNGTATGVTPPSLDILNLTLSQGNGNPPIGALGLHQMDLDYANPYDVGPAIQFTGKAERILTFYAKAGVQFTKSVWVYYDPDAENENYPQLIARGKYITTQTDTGSLATEWEQLSVSATPTADGIIELVLKAPQAAGDVTKFSDPS